ncbi:MAG: fumarylacetoacetate hydrolase family protein, partial [Methylococcaceae bacterium]
MKLATFTYQHQTRIGAVIENQIIDGLGDVSLPTDMIEFLEQGDSALQKMQRLISSEAHRILLADVQLLAPIPRPRKFLGIGLNYADHIDETGLEKPEYPMFFTKQSSCVIGHGMAIEMPIVSEKVDYEGELAFVIGKRCKNVSVENAHNV